MYKARMTLRHKIYIALFAALMIFVVIPFAGIYIIQRAIVFPIPEHAGPAEPGGGFAPVVVETPDGERLNMLYHPEGAAAASILVFHGSAEIAADQLDRGRTLAAAGYGVLIAEYRGYGGSSGSPSEEGVITDGIAAYDFLAAKAGGPIGLLAHSMGAAIAVPVAAARDPFAVVLESPFLSLLEVTRYRVGWVPFDFMMKYPFHSDRRISAVKAPILIIHGSEDKVVPFRQGEKLATLAPKGTAFIKIDEAGHNDLGQYGDMKMVRTFFHKKNAARTVSDGDS
ncbi:MAG: hypothetical protein CMN55_13330 [Sneathiella sp.]|nr:hypothetical protein [Sneathiella sp.]